MIKAKRNYSISGIELTIMYSRRRTIGISVLPDASVIVRVPYITSLKTIERIVKKKAGWITRHSDNYRKNKIASPKIHYRAGEIHLFRGNESVLRIEKSPKSYVKFFDNTIEVGLNMTDDEIAVKKLLYKGYKNEAADIFPEIMNKVLEKNDIHMFKPAGLIIRTMKRRWGSCSNKGIITLSTELIKLPDRYTEYVIAHELCHLKHHNHGKRYYDLLSVVFPEWKTIRKEMKKYISN
jgi:predicted metal-dependent hydrolase